MVTIADVAARAGVAPSTVSYVLSGKRSISRLTRARVEESVRALGYHPRRPTRWAEPPRPQVLGLAAPLHQGTNLPVLMRFVSAVTLAAREHGMDVLLLTGDRGPDGFRETVRAGGLDGLVVMDVEMRDARMPVLQELGLPSVLIGFPVDQAGLTAVDLDFAAAGARCLDHLADLGHRSVALLGSAPPVYLRDTGFAHRTAAGFTTAAVRRGVSVTTRATDSCPVAVRAMIAELLREHPRLSGLVVHNEGALAPVLDALGEFGRRVPEDISVVALCPDELAERQHPRLTSVDLPAEELGRRAVELVLAKLTGAPCPVLTLLPPRLTERGSVRRRRPV